MLPCSQRESRIHFRKYRENTFVPALSQARIRTWAEGPPWNGLQLEVGTTSSWKVDDVMVNGHIVAFNLADEPLRLNLSQASGWTTVDWPAGSIWINPEGRPFSVRVDGPAHWAAFLIDGRLLDAALGKHHELTPVCGSDDNVIVNLSRALIHHAEAFDPLRTKGDMLTQSLIRAFLLALAHRHAVPSAGSGLRGGLAPHQLSGLLRWIDSNLDSRITVDAMAARAGLSVAHFSREFKRATGSTPWSHLVQVRLRRARMLLREGESLSSVAAACGFCDQTHFARVFKQHYGVTSKQFLRQASDAESIDADELSEASARFRQPS